MPRFFDEDRGTIIHDDRNQIRLVVIDGMPIVLKRFKRRNLKGRLRHTFFRKNKARCAFENAKELLKRGFDTPQPIAYMEVRRIGIIEQVYFACEYTDASMVDGRLTDSNRFDKDLAIAYAHFVAHMHEKGIQHCDLNPLNTLVTKREGRYHFQLIDINRMCFYDCPLPIKESIEEWNLLWWLSDEWLFILREYAAVRGWSEDNIAMAIEMKKQHDDWWVSTNRYNKRIFGERPRDKYSFGSDHLT